MAKKEEDRDKYIQEIVLDYSIKFTKDILELLKVDLAKTYKQLSEQLFENEMTYKMFLTAIDRRINHLNKLDVKKLIDDGPKGPVN